ncbi:hypothetical protein BJX99DRAFT_37469 [Aspergillus californicus]
MWSNIKSSLGTDHRAMPSKRLSSNETTPENPEASAGNTRICQFVTGNYPFSNRFIPFCFSAVRKLTVRIDRLVLSYDQPQMCVLDHFVYDGRGVYSSSLLGLLFCMSFYLLNSCFLS